MKFYGGVRGGNRNMWLDFDSNLDCHADCPIRNPAITQHIMSGLWWNFQDSSSMTQETIDEIFGVIWTTVLTLQIGNPGNYGAN